MWELPATLGSLCLTLLVAVSAHFRIKEAERRIEHLENEARALDKELYKLQQRDKEPA